MSNNGTVMENNATQGMFLVPITGAVITDSILNFQTDISNTAVCEEAVGCQLDITLELQRPGLVKAIVILTVLINCECKADTSCCQRLIRTHFRAHHTLDMHTHRRGYHSRTNVYSEWLRRPVHLPDLNVCPPVRAKHSTWRATIWLSP